jgi:hypothetical protein
MEAQSTWNEEEEPTTMTVFFALMLEFVAGRLAGNHNQTRLRG